MTGKKMRHVDHGVLLASFAERVIAVCPSCQGPALVVCKSKYAVPFIPKNARVHCLRCSFGRTSADDEWFGPATGLIKERCPTCGYKWIKETMQRKGITSKTQKTKVVQCPSCEHKVAVPIHWVLNRFEGEAIDPVFGLPLWLRTSCAGNSLWAYNKKHLQALTAYVGATLRKRTAGRRWSMFSRLPQWLKSAKNRENILRGLSRLEKRLEEAEPR
jgi:DNA-directed RNA polymerase subunit RPC12/RpoP